MDIVSNLIIFSIIFNNIYTILNVMNLLKLIKNFKI